MKPTLFLLAAGMGSRYGGLKQMDGLGPNGETIMDYSIYDAIKAGFGKLVFVIRKDFEDDFRKKIVSKYENHLPVEVVFQSLDKLPEGFTVPEGREKPWGTNHAVMMGEDVIKEPFAVINCDDFYGRDSFQVMGKFLSELPEGSTGKYAMVGFRVGNTLSESGTVSRGVCATDASQYLQSVVERTKIAKRGEDAAFTEDGETWTPLSGESRVSMNFWGFGLDMLRQLRDRFPAWLDENLPKNPEKAEYFLPFVANSLIHEGLGTVEVLPCHENWHGITYKEDMPDVLNYIAQLRREGVYPETLLD